MLGLSLPQSILIVEDNILIAMEIEENLRGLGCVDVRSAGNLQDALELVDTHRFDFVVLDVKLGAVTSEEVAICLRSADVPFVLSTGFDEEIAELEPFRDVPVLIKPYACDELLSAMQKSLA